MIVDPITLSGSSRPGALPPDFRPIATDVLPPLSMPASEPGVPDAAVIAAADDLKRLSALNEEVWGREPTDHADEDPVHVEWEQEATAASDALTGAINRLTDMPVATPAGVAAIADAMPSLSAFIATCDGWPELKLLLKLAGDVVRIGREAPAGADDHIIRLAADYWRLRRIEHAAGEEDDRLRPIYLAQRPVPPTEIRREAIKHYAKLSSMYYHSDGTEAGSHISKQAVDWLRVNPRTRPVMVTWKDGTHTFERARDDAAEARVQAMLAVYDQWEAECLAVAERIGSRAAELAYERANDEASTAAIRLCEARPATLLGAAVMASVITDRNWNSDAVDLAEKLAPLAGHLRPSDIPVTGAEPGLGLVPVREVA